MAVTKFFKELKKNVEKLVSSKTDYSLIMGGTSEDNIMFKDRFPHKKIINDRDYCCQMLESTIRHSNNELFCWLLLNGLDVSSPYFHSGERKLIMDTALAISRKFNPATSKFLLSYGADYEHFRAEKWCARRIEFLDDVKKECYELYSCVTDGDRLLIGKDYKSAQKKYTRAIDLLRTFALLEETKLSDPKYNTDQILVDAYWARLHQCEDKVRECDLQLNTDSFAGSASETDSLLHKESIESALRHRSV